MSSSESEVVADILARWQPYGRTGLLPCLIDVQDVLGWLPPDVCARVGEALRVPLADVYGVATFYSLLYTEPVGQWVVRVCDDVACLANGSPAILEAAQTALGLSPGETSPDGLVTLEVHPCLGQCDRAPCLTLNHHVFGPLDPPAVERLVHALRAGEGASLLSNQGGAPVWGTGAGHEAVLLRRVGRVDPTSLADYEAHGGYRALRAALEMQPAEIVEMVKASGLVGRGGAAFPTGIKWESAARQPAPRYIVCNADESEPGTFKDRILMEGDPFAIVEAMTIAAYAVGAERGYIYVRGEFRTAYDRLASAVAAAREAGYLGERVMGRDFSFDIELRRGAGAYVCGEETALFESIEGKRGMPRQKPPFPTEKGLFGRPTVINNVETFANVPHIVLNGPEWFRRIGPPDAPGPKLFCVSGAVSRPGVYEAPMSITLRQLLDECAGGVRPGHTLQAVLVGGAAGTFLFPEHLDTSMSFEALRSVGAAPGSGAVLVVDNSTEMLEVVERITRFFAHESCGKCYPCQLGTWRQWEIMRRWQAGHRRPDDVERLQDLAHAMREASICGLGQTAASALMSVLPRLEGRETG